MTESFVNSYLDETAAILEHLDRGAIERTAQGLARVRDAGGRLFILGVGGSAAHASHAVNDFRKICGFEAYAPTDNVAELTARINDDGWDTSYVEWLRGSHLDDADALLILSVGGGDQARGVSTNLVQAMELAAERNVSVFGIVGRDGGHTARVADSAVVVPALYPERITPHTEGLCAVIWHLLVSHPVLQQSATRWETVASASQ